MQIFLLIVGGNIAKSTKIPPFKPIPLTEGESQKSKVESRGESGPARKCCNDLML